MAILRDLVAWHIKWRWKIISIGIFFSKLEKEILCSSRWMCSWGRQPLVSNVYQSTVLRWTRKQRWSITWTTLVHPQPTTPWGMAWQKMRWTGLQTSFTCWAMFKSLGKAWTFLVKGGCANDENALTSTCNIKAPQGCLLSLGCLFFNSILTWTISAIEKL